jgi:hypothetical protein
LELKIHAMSVAAKKVKQGTDVAWFLDKLHKVEAELESIPSLLQNYIDLISNLGPTRLVERVSKQLEVQDFMELYERLKKSLSSDGEHNGAAETSQEIAPLYEEFATYIYYCVTLLQFFDDSLNALTISNVEEKALDQLARARQSLSVNPKVTRLMIDEFRKPLDMTVPSVMNIYHAKL